MATRTDKQTFFAQLDGLDESTETESESDLEHEVVQAARRKRQRLSKDVKSSDIVSVTDNNVTASDHTWTNKMKSSIRPNSPVLERASTDLTVNKEKSVPRKNQQKTTRRTKSASEPSKERPKSGQSSDKKRLFDALTFYFIPNDDVVKPRRLRIQSAVAQGARWTRQLEPGVTHVIVEPEVTASAVVKYIKDKVNIPGIAFVKTNWLTESLSHKSVSNPKDGRFQLKGASVAFAEIQRLSSAEIISSKNIVSVPQVPAKPKDFDVPVTNAEDELDRIVQSVKTATHLPFDEELDLDNLLSFSSGDEKVDKGLDQSHRAGSGNRKPHDDSADELQNQPVTDTRNTGFQCMDANPTVQDPSPNDHTISILQQMATYYDRTGDNWRTVAYRRAIAALRKETVQITTAKQARAIRGIGTRLADKIEEIATTDRLQRLDAVLSDPDDAVLQLFVGIYGAGIRQARTWMEEGHRTLKDLVQNAKLSTNQKIGIEHHADFAQRITRAEVKRHGDIVAQALKVADRDLQAIIGGSYRRGMPDSGDIDVIITHPTATLSQLQTWVFDTIVPHLFKIDFMKCALATSRPAITASTPRRSAQSQSHTNSTSTSDETQSLLNPTGTTTTGSKFLGASQLPSSPGSSTPPWRRIDLLLVPPTSIGAALIYFTGNDIFNRSIRLLASKKGMRLNQHGLYRDVMRGKGRVKITEGELVEGRSEKKIFEVLGIPWREAEQRRC